MKVLALGVGEEQLDAIQYAIANGLYVVGIDRSRSLPGAKLVNEFYEIDLKDVDEIIAQVKDLDIEFIIPSTIGSLLTTIGKVNDELNLPGINQLYSELLTDKEKYFGYLKKKGLYVPKRITINNSSYISFKKKIGNFRFPFILKPSKGSGSRGVIIVQNQEAMHFAFSYSISSLLENEVLIAEEFVEGQEYGVDFIIASNQINILCIRKKILTSKPFRQEIGYITHNSLNKLQPQILNELNKFFQNEHKIDNVIGNLDVIITQDFLYFIEMSLRPAGLGIMYNYLPHAIGYNPVHNMINVLSKKSQYNKPNYSDNYTFMFLFDLPSGVVESLPKEEELMKMNYVKNCSVLFKKGSYLSKVKSGKDIMSRGYLIMSGLDQGKVQQEKELIFTKFIIEKGI